MAARASFPLCLLLGCTLCILPAPVLAEGQYRSRILLTPEEDWFTGAELSVEELEQQLGSIEEAYARSSAGRHLARHYVQRKEYDKAIEYYRQALQADGLADVANREMLRELAQVYLLSRDYRAAAESLQRMLALDLVPEPADLLLLARAQHHLGSHVEVVASLDQLQQSALVLDASQLQQATALYYHAGAYAQAEPLLRRLLAMQPDEARHWHLLVSVYLQQNKRQQALDRLALARGKGIPFAERDTLLLVNLHAANGSPYDAARLLQEVLSTGELPGNGANYRMLFELWLQAREARRAVEALRQAATLSGDIDLYLHLAQLQMEQEDFSAMLATLQAACARPLPEQHLGRANLLLGISQLKLGDDAAARRSFINASLVGGVNIQAGEWLRFMQAAPVTDREARGIVGPCHGEGGQHQAYVPHAAAAGEKRPVATGAAEDAAVAEQGAFEVKVVPPLRLFYREYDEPLAELFPSLRARVASMGRALVRSGGTIDGPLHVLLDSDALVPDSRGVARIGLPYRGGAHGDGTFSVGTMEAFKCAALSFEGPGNTLRTAVAKLAAATLAAGHELTGEARIIIPPGNNAESFRAELQLGIR